MSFLGRRFYQSRAALDAPSAGTGNDSFTKILLHMEGSNGGTTFTDSNAGGSAHTWTASSATTSTTQFKFGSTALSSGAGAGKITTPDSADYTLGSGAFTIDCWFYRSGGDGAVREICGQADAAASTTSQTAMLYLNSSNVMVFRVWSGGAQTDVTGTTVFTSTGWHHVAGVRTGNTLKLFIDGVQEGGDVAFALSIQDSTGSYGVGGLGDFATVLWNGFIDEFRLSVGVARWTSNFTPASAAYS